MGEFTRKLAERFPDNTLVKRLPPQDFYTAYLSILYAQVSSGAKETWGWLTALCYTKKPIKSPSRGHFEVEFRELTGIPEKTGRDHVAELVHAGLLQCYRTSRREFLLYPVGVVPLPDTNETAQLTLLDVGEPKAKSNSWRKSAKTVGENSPKLEGQEGRSASLKPTYLPNPNTTNQNLTVKVGENSPKLRRNSAKSPVSAPTFGENPPKLKREKQPPPRQSKADTSKLSTEALVIFERLELVGFWDEPAVVVARNAAAQGYSADEVVTRAQTIIEELETEPGINDVMSVAIHRLAKFVVRPKKQKKASTATQIHADQEAQQNRVKAYYASTTAAERLVDSLLDMPPAERRELLDLLPPDQRDAWSVLPTNRQEALLVAPQKRLSNTG